MKVTKLVLSRQRQAPLIQVLTKASCGGQGQAVHMGIGPQWTLKGWEEGPRTEGAGRTGAGGRGSAQTHLLVAALVEIVLSGRHAQGGLVYLETQRL